MIIYHECEIIKVITGVRRCGKSSIMKMISRELLEQGVHEDNILYKLLQSEKIYRHRLCSVVEKAMEVLSDDEREIIFSRLAVCPEKPLKRVPGKIVKSC